MSDSRFATGVLLGARVAAVRLRHRQTAGALLLAATLTVTGAWIELSAGSLGAVDRSLASTFRVVIPLFCFALVSRVTTSAGLGESTFVLARFGAPRHAVALGLGSAASAISALVSAVFAALAVVFSHSAAAPPLWSDMLTAAWVGFATALAYCGWTLVGSTFYRGKGRFVPIAIDFLLGGGTGFFAALLPRAHASRLLGLEPGPLGFSSTLNFACLFLMAIGLTAISAFRSGR